MSTSNSPALLPSAKKLGFALGQNGSDYIKIKTKTGGSKKLEHITKLNKSNLRNTFR